MKREKINTIDHNDNNKIYYNLRGYPFKIVGKDTEVRVNNNGTKRWYVKYWVEFLDTGTKKLCDCKEITTGVIKDDYAPSVYGVGITGTEIDHPQSHYLYNRWSHMIRRCYDEKANGYTDYGAVGVTVSEEWKYFPNFVRDIEAKENHEKLKTTHKDPNMRYEIDKDLIKNGNKVYCNEYTSIVSHYDNLNERNIRHDYNRDINSKPIWRISKDLTEVKEYRSASEAGRSNDKWSSSSISNCTNKNTKSVYGYYWRKQEDYDSLEDAILDIKNTIHMNK